MGYMDDANAKSVREYQRLMDEARRLWHSVPQEMRNTDKPEPIGNTELLFSDGR